MSWLQPILLVLVAGGATAVVLERNLVGQAILLSFYGLLLTLLFLALQAPDVAFSELTIGSAALPLILLVTVAKVRARER